MRSLLTILSTFVLVFLFASAAHAAQPTVLLERTSPSSETVFSQEDVASWSITFSENVTGFTQSDIEILQDPGGTWELDLSGSGSLWNLRAWRSSGSGDGALQIAVAEGSVMGSEPGPFNPGRVSSEFFVDQSSPRAGGFSGGGITGTAPGSAWSSPSNLVANGNWVDSAQNQDQTLALSSDGKLLLYDGSLSTPPALSGTGWVAAASSGSQWMVISQSGSVRVSANGSTWNLGPTLPGSETWVDLAFYSGSFWALSASGSLVRFSGGIWTEQSSFGSAGWTALASQGPRLVAINTSGATRRLLAGSWTSSALPAGSGWNNVMGAPSGWLVSSASGDMAFSPDGHSWQEVSWTGSVDDIYFWQGRFYAISGNSVFFSGDGSLWSSASLPFGFSGQEIAAGGSLLFALSSSSISLAYDAKMAASQPSFSLSTFTDNDQSLSVVLRRQTASKSGGICTSDWSEYVVVSGAASLASDKCYLYTLQATDRASNSFVWQRVIDTANPPNVTSFERISPTGDRVRNNELSYRIIFDEPVQSTSFSAGDILFNGTAAPSWVVDSITNPSGNNQNWLLEISAGALQEGTLEVGLGASSVEDLSGTLGPASTEWSASSTTIDLQPPPDPAWSVQPPATIGSSTATFSLVSPEAGARFICQIDALPEAECQSPHSWSNLSGGTHTARFWQEDEAGNRSGVLEHSFVVDVSAPPAPSILSGPDQSSFVSSTSASFSWSGEAGASFFCTWDSGTEEPCSSPASRSGLSNGAHTFSVRARDAGGNFSPATTRNWTVDTVAPVSPTWTSTPPNPSGSGEAGFYWSGENWASFQCQLGQGSWAGCSSPRLLSGLMSGDYVFRVRQIDRAGNISSPAEWQWEIIRGQPPQPTLNQKPNSYSPLREATFAFSSSSNDTYQCSLDNAAWQSCSSPQSFGNLADGPHSFRVRHINAVQVAGTAASWTWTVDTVEPPLPQIITKPASWTVASSASFSWSGELGVSSECSLNDADWQTCSSIHEITDLAEREHLFRVRSKDSAGNYSDPASWSWTVDRTAPSAVEITEGPPASGSTLLYRFAWTGEPQSQSQCSLDGAPWDVCQSPLELQFVSAGRHTFSIRQKDRAGNVSPVASRSWTIDISMPDPPEIIDFPGKRSNKKRASFSWIVPQGMSSECRVEGSWQKCKSPWDYAPRKEGRHVFSVRAVNSAGTASPAAQKAWFVDWTPPRLQSVSLQSLGSGTWKLSLQSSGASRIEFASRKGKAENQLLISATVRLRKKPTWARVLDDAGNASPWKKIKS